MVKETLGQTIHTFQERSIENPPKFHSFIIVRAAKVNGALIGSLKFLPKIETPEELQELSEIISDFQIFKKHRLFEIQILLSTRKF